MDGDRDPGLEDCPACDRREDALAARAEDPAAALALLATTLEDPLGCPEEPHTSLALCAELHLDLGDVDAAAGTYRRAWDLLAPDLAPSEAVAACLRVLVRLGNSDRALDQLLPRLRWLDDAAEEDRMWFAATAAWVLRHARRLGFAPELVEGRPVEDVEQELADLGDTLAARSDARAGDDASMRALATALDDRTVAPEPTLAPTRLPGGLGAPDRRTPLPTSAEEVVVLAARVDEARRRVDPATERALRGWLAARASVEPLLDTPAEWAAAAALDRLGATLVPDPEHARALLHSAAAAAVRAGDPVEVGLAEATQAAIDVREVERAHGRDSAEALEARTAATDLLRALESTAPADAAADAWRWYALTTRPQDADEVLLAAAVLHESVGEDARRAVCLLDAAAVVLPVDEEAGEDLVEQALALAGDTPTVRTQALELRARVARATGDLEGALAHYDRVLVGTAPHDVLRLGPLLSLCDLLVEQEDWTRLEVHAADALACAVRLRDPVGLAVAQRHLGLAWVETGRASEGAELLHAALPVVEEHVPALLGPTGWALGNAALQLGTMHVAHEAFAAAGASFERSARLVEAGHSRHRAGVAAWETGDLDAALEQVELALVAARMAGASEVLFRASLVRAALRAVTVDLDVGLSELDEVLPRVERFAAARVDRGEEPFDVEVHEPDILRQGAHLLADGGRTDEAVARLDRARDLVGGGHELVLEAEAALMLAGADRLADAEPRLRPLLDRLRRAGLTAECAEVAGGFARALDRAGRVPEAEEVWAAYGPRD